MLTEVPKLQLRLDAALRRQEMMQRELSEKDGLVADLERKLVEASGTMESLRRENRDLSSQVSGWADQYNYIQESTSVVVEKSARKNMEYKSKEAKLMNRTARLEDENRTLRRELAMMTGEVQALNQTNLMLRSEHHLLARLNEDLEARLKAVRNPLLDRKASQIRSVTDSQIERSLNFDLEIRSIGSLQTFKADNEGVRVPSTRHPAPAKPDNRAAEAEIDSRYCRTTKCSIF